MRRAIAAAPALATGIAGAADGPDAEPAKSSPLEDPDFQQKSS